METDFYPAYYQLEGRHWWFLGRRHIFLAALERFAPKGPARALDFGCGTGAWLEHLERFAPVDALDGDRDAVAFCHQRGRLEVQYLEPGAPIPFADASFDIITSFDVLEHIEDDGATLRELHRVLRPGGTLVLAVPAFPILWGDQDEISHHFRRYRTPRLVAPVEAAGLTVLHTSYFNSLLFPAVAAVRLVRRVVRAPRSDKTDFTVGPAAANSLLARLFGAESRLVTRRRIPFGVSLLLVARR